MKGGRLGKHMLYKQDPRTNEAGMATRVAVNEAEPGNSEVEWVRDSYGKSMEGPVDSNPRLPN